MTPATLIFVYNAPDGLGAALIDAVHKIVAPESYPCSLCAVTYGAVAMKRRWKDHLRALPHDVRFYHRDGFARVYPALAAAKLPLVLIAREGAPQVLLDADRIDAAHDLDALIAALDGALAEEASAFARRHSVTSAR